MKNKTIYFNEYKIILTFSSIHLANNLRLLNSHSNPDFVIAYELSLKAPLPQQISIKSLFLNSPKIADRPINGIGSLF